MSNERQGRMRTAMDPRKAFRQYDEMRRSGKLERALIIAETTDGHFHVLGQMTDPAGCARLCMIAADALAQIPEDKRGGPPVDFSPPPPPPPSASAPVRIGGRPVFTMAAAWASFEQTVLSAEVGGVQRREMRRAFYCGAQELFTTILNGLEPGDEETSNDLSLLDGLDEELARFADDLRAGRA